MAKKSIIESQRVSAKDEVKYNLDTYGKCAFIRPTGWGKTWTVASLVDDYEKVLYLYPGDAIRDTFLFAYYSLHLQPVKKSIKNVTLLTYAGLRRKKPAQLKKYADYDLIIADECDILGAPETMRAMSDLLNVAKNAHVLGATATPERQDMVDEIAIFFEDRLISDYTLHDAIQDNVIKKPYYVVGCYDDTAEEVINSFKRRTAMEVDKMNTKDQKQLLGATLEAKRLELAQILNMENTIPEELAKAGISTDYQKYIVFFSSFVLIAKQAPQVKSWFEKAFPNHSIHTLEITSEDLQKTRNVDKLGDLKYESNRIDLLFTCNMLNAGYHVSDLTGIIMMRGTTSNRIFTQQLGRVLSSGALKPGIVFDIADNLHRPAAYEMCWNVSSGDESDDGVITDEEIKEYKELVNKSAEKDENGRPVILPMKERKRLIYLKKKIQSADAKKRGNTPKRQLLQDDLIISSRIGTVREIMGKTVAEAVSMRCRQAWSRWLEKGGDASVMTKEFILSQTAPNQTPLPPFCRLKHVSVEAVLDEMGVV